MKNKIIFGILASCAMGLSLTSCEDAENPVIENMVYFSEASASKSKVVSLSDGVTNTSLTVRLAQSHGSNVKATISVDESLLADYNKVNETNFQSLDQAKFTFEKDVTIEAGKVSSAPVNISISEFQTLGVRYAIPLKVTVSGSDVEAAQSSSRIILFLEKPLRQPVPRFGWENASKALPESDWGVTLENYTLEWWVKMSGFSINNQAIINSGGSQELYIRFGDLVYADGGTYVYNFLQVKTMGSQFDTGDPTKGYGLQANTWYHFALVYNSAEGTTYMYKNGEQVGKLAAGGGVPMRFDRMMFCSSGSQYFRDKCEMCQVRLWKTARTANQIVNNMYNDVDPNDPDLELYIPMNEGEGSTLHDISGNGHDVPIGNGGGYYTSGDVTWSTYTFAK